MNDRIVFGTRPPGGALVAALLLAALVLTGTAAFRGWEYDEGYTIFLAAGQPRPDWPDGPFRAGAMRGAYVGHSTAGSIARDLRATDVHPPLYFWSVAAWRGLLGPGLFVTRLFSVVCSLAALVALIAACRRLDLPPVAATLLAIGCYGFAYTGGIARGFALAQAFAGAGLWLAAGARGPRRGFAAGLAYGAGMLTNYLAAFGAAAGLLWLLLHRWRRPATWLAGGIGFALCLPPALFFFLAQRGSRVGQFPPFHLGAGVLREARYAAANIFGGLPLYAAPPWSALLAALLAAAFLAAIGLIAWRWRRIARPDSRLLLALTTVATPVGLLALGMVFDNTPIELRYLAFAVPAFAALAAGALATLPPHPRAAAFTVTLAVQAASLAGMMTMPQTMQPQEAVAHEAAALAGPDALVLVPHGNDGVGVLGAVVANVPDRTRILAVPAGESAAALAGAIAGENRVVLAPIGGDADSRAVLPVMRQAVAGVCWRPAGADGEAEAFDRSC